MTRLLIAAVIVIVMAVLAIQNQEATALTILGNRQTPQIPFGLLLVSAFSAGSLLTLFLYGLVGLQRPPESKYRPMGRRVPYPDSPGSSNLPPSGPTPSPTAPPYATANQSYSSSTAFVSESPSQDSSPQGASQEAYQGASQEAYQGTPFASPQDSYGADSPPASSASSPPVQSAYTPPVFPDRSTDAAPESVTYAPKPEKKKSRFASLGDNLLKKKPESESAEEKRVGNDWGDLRTAEQLNSWEAEEVRRASGATEPRGKRGLLDFIGVGTSTQSPQPADRLADDIAAGWDESSYSDEARPYEDDLDSGWGQGYGQDNAEDAAGNPQKRVYRDGLYADDDYAEGPYAEGPYESDTYVNQDPYEEGIEADDVYEADYRVIVPPSKPLEEISEKKEDEPYV